MAIEAPLHGDASLLRRIRATALIVDMRREWAEAVSMSVKILEDVLSREQAAEICRGLRGVEFTDGADTAGVWGRAVKKNKQWQGPRKNALAQSVVRALLSCRDVSRWACATATTDPTFNRYEVGDFYGRHEDSAVQMGVRADLSYTLFLNDPDEYVGGELRLDLPGGRRAFRLPAGAAVLYCSGTTHEVTCVEHGVRCAAVGWIQSGVRDAYKRETLFEFGQVLEQLHSESGVTTEFGRLSALYARLTRMWYSNG